ncbi:hypothetical protein [Vibrio barjaei]|uniref:hypothetical protein n=1 Tax=Vibrio barjaei TaxID=1676683 RepID=UPI00228420BD|nr:hypothetical protein [Vibrio barjaei]MCY9872957.1 hypothetical protein [Vibrio barjaei]
MIIKKPTFIDKEVDCICDACGDSLYIKVAGERIKEGGQLSAEFGFASDGEDGNRYQVDLCQKCFFSTISSIKKRRNLLSLFAEDFEQPDETFGKVND